MELNYKVFGEGEPLIILHGLFGMLDNWQTLAKQFAEQFTVYIIDLRNHGKSPRTDNFDYYFMADDIAAFIENHELESVFVMGHSMGGKVAMQLAVSYPEVVKKLVIVDIAPKDYPAGHDDVFAAFNGVDLKNTSSRKEAEAQMLPLMPNFGVRQFLLKNLDRNKDKTYQWKANIEVIKENYDEIIKNSLTPYDQFDEPTLFIKGGDSPRYIEPDEDWAIITHHFPEAKLEVIDNAGHWVHAQQPEKLKDIVLKFLGE